MADRSLPLDPSQLAGATKLDDDGKTATLQLGDGRRLSVFSTPDLDAKLSAANPPDAGRALGAQGGGSFNSAAPATGPSAPSSDDIPGLLRKPMAVATGAWDALMPESLHVGGALALNSARHPDLNALGQAAGNPLALVQPGGAAGMGSALGDFLLDRAPPAAPAPAAAAVAAPPSGQPGPAAAAPPTPPPAAAQPAAAQGKVSVQSSQRSSAGGAAGGPFNAGTGAIATGEAERMQGTADEAKAQQAQNEGLAKLQGAEADRKQQAAQSLQALQDFHAQEQRQTLGKAQALIESLDTTVKSPQQIWSTKGAGEKFGLVLGQVLAGIGGGMQGRPPEDLIRKSIGEEVAAQREAYERKKDKAGQVLNLYGKLREQGLSEEQAQEATSGALAKVAEDRLKAYTTGTSNPIVAARAKSAIGAMRVDMGEKFQNTAKLAADIAHTRAATDLARQQAATALAQAQNKGSANGLVVGGSQVHFSDEKEKAEFEKQQASATTLRNALQEVVESGAKPGAIATIQRLLGIGKDANAATAARDTATISIGPAIGQKRGMNSPMIERFNHALTNAWNPDAVKAGAYGVVGHARQALAQALIAKGADPTTANELALRQLPPLPGESGAIGAQEGFK